jgi:tRNA-splicing ligase RtcB
MSWEGPIDKVDDYRFEIPTTYQTGAMKEANLRMRVPGLIYADEKMLRSITRDNSPDQVANVATLPGIIGRSFAMPDIHHGYGFAIGGVAAFDADEGVISPGGVGYDINCGVRLLRTDFNVGDIRPRIEKLVQTMFKNVPSGVGSESRHRLSAEEINKVLQTGARWAVENGYGWDDDLEYTEQNGRFEEADASTVSKSAKKRGMPQLGTLGAGNHFLEIQRVDEIYDREAAALFGIVRENQITVMIHTGSRGCGHQICTDYLDVMRQANRKYGIPLVDKQLSCAPASSPEGQQYFSAMQCGANFAWANRQVIMHWVRQSFESVFGKKAADMGLSLIYDIAHNIARCEEHDVEGKPRRVYVHRKGATRAFGPERPEVPEKYRSLGQPVLIPGDMGTASYLLVGTEQAMRETFGSSCHGAGRVMSRHAAIKKNRPDQIMKLLNDRQIYLQAKSRKLISEEAPDAYKDIDHVIEVSHQSGLARKVARMCPMGVVKG